MYVILHLFYLLTKFSKKCRNMFDGKMRNNLLLTYETWNADSICFQISKPWGIGYIPSIKWFIKFQACRLIRVIIKTTRIFFHGREIEYLIFLARLTNYKYVWFVQVKINYCIFQYVLSHIFYRNELIFLFTIEKM